MDSNVILDVTWKERRSSVLVIKSLIYAEASIGFDAIEIVEQAPPIDLYRRSRSPSAPIAAIVPLARTDLDRAILAASAASFSSATKVSAQAVGC